ncbi:MAG: FkbM family methyltransferase [Bdellovibrionales bacterium]|nr:FkbM family methyltransferase [Bdellovibrionales bacterium]
MNQLLKRSFGRRVASSFGPRFFEKEIRVNDIDFRMYLDLHDRWGVSAYILKHGGYDTTLTKIAAKILGSGKGCILDIGANIGFWSLFFSKISGRSKIYAYEPAPDNLSLLAKNIALNSATSAVQIIPKALGETRSRLDLYISEDNAGDHQLYSTQEARRHVQVEVESFDEEHPDELVDFIKIDVQGFEPFVIKGLTRALQKNEHVKIIMEYWPMGIQRAGADPIEMLQRLKEMGFIMWAVVPNSGAIQKVTPESARDLCQGDVHTDLILSRSELAL